MAVKKTRATAEQPASDGVLHTVARTVGSTLGTLVAKTEKALESSGQAVEELKARALKVGRKPPVRKTGVVARKTSPAARKKASPARKKIAAVRKPTASARRASRAAARRKSR